jgi:hypothetical protein
MLSRWSMEASEDRMTWTIPLHLVMWTTIAVVLLMAIVVALMR